jgi:hypothetical protein
MHKKILALIGLVLQTGCTMSIATLEPPTATAATVSPIPSTTSTFISTTAPTDTPVSFTAVPTLTLAPPPVTTSFCNDSQVIVVIDSLKSSVQTSNGELLSSLAHPARGMEVRWVRYGNAITYTVEQAKFLYETTFEADWGDEPGSGSPKTGSFHDVIVPDLARVFDQPYALHCNELKHGGATYELEFPYEGNFYSIYFGGTDANGFLDWHTWVIGIDYVNGKPYIYAMMQFFWEP